MKIYQNYIKRNDGGTIDTETISGKITPEKIESVKKAQKARLESQGFTVTAQKVVKIPNGVQIIAEGHKMGVKNTVKTDYQTGSGSSVGHCDFNKLYQYDKNYEMRKKAIADGLIEVYQKENRTYIKDLTKKGCEIESEFNFEELDVKNQILTEEKKPEKSYITENKSLTQGRTISVPITVEFTNLYKKTVADGDVQLGKRNIMFYAATDFTNNTDFNGNIELKITTVNHDHVGSLANQKPTNLAFTINEPTNADTLKEKAIEYIPRFEEFIKQNFFFLKKDRQGRYDLKEYVEETVRTYQSNNPSRDAKKAQEMGVAPIDDSKKNIAAGQDTLDGLKLQKSETEYNVKSQKKYGGFIKSSRVENYYMKYLQK